MGRGQRPARNGRTKRVSGTKVERLRPLPPWQEIAEQFRDFTLSDARIAEEITRMTGETITAAAVADHFEKLYGAAPTPRRWPSGFTYDGLLPTLDEARLARIGAERERRLADGESLPDVDEWHGDELARYGRVAHRCYRRDSLFTSREAVAAFARRLRRWQRVIGRPVAGEDAEHLVAEIWRELGHQVMLAPRNNPGADVHVRRNRWVAISMKSEARSTPSQRAIEISSIASHPIKRFDDAGDVKLAMMHAAFHLRHYDRMIHLRSTTETFPDSDDEAHRYTFLEVPIDDIVDRLLSVQTMVFRHYFDDPGEAHARNSFHHDVVDERGRRLFRVTVSKRPPHVRISAITLEYCQPIASYWVEPIANPPRGTPPGKDGADAKWRTIAALRTDVRRKRT